MADENADAGAEEGAEAPKPKLKLSPQLILALVNSVFVLAALGVTVFTKLLYEKPAITEAVEIKKEQEEAAKPAEPVERALVKFDLMRVNIAMTSGKAHFASVEFAAECRSQDVADQLTAKKDKAMDKVISFLGRKQLTELNTVQGKMLLKTSLMREFGEITKPGGVTDIYFSTFILQ